MRYARSARLAGLTLRIFSQEKLRAIERFRWQETYRAMAAEREDWSDLDLTVADGLD